MLTARSHPQQGKTNHQNYLFHLDNLSVEYGGIKALKNVQLTIYPGEILFVTGPSGAGKTSLLNVLGGHLEPTSGKAILPHQRSSKHFCSTVFQDLRLMQKKSCEENLWLAFDSSIYNTKNDFHREMEDLARLMGVAEHLNRKIEDCNGGFKQKIAMIRALLSRPTALLADEPTSSLDKDNSYRLFEVLNHLNHKKGLTIVWATHNKELIKQFPGKIAHLDNGRLVYSGHACFI
ncbi:MAG TPA: ATP-binding cassette domain-containing protein [Bacteriovoracaceae bacterium]|nr:ATP-binding cassette domain-containing protein [Bacteriovoracaceae bacterium]